MQEIRQGSKGDRERARRVASRKRGVSERVRGVLDREVSEGVLAKGLRLYNKGMVHETAIPWVFRVGSDGHAGYFGHEVDLSVGSCQCRAYEMRGYVCRHVVAAGAAWVARGES